MRKEGIKQLFGDRIQTAVYGPRRAWLAHISFYCIPYLTLHPEQRRSNIMRAFSLPTSRSSSTPIQLTSNHVETFHRFLAMLQLKPFRLYWLAIFIFQTSLFQEHDQPREPVCVLGSLSNLFDCPSLKLDAGHEAAGLESDHQR
jgi:hypothetical protein